MLAVNAEGDLPIDLVADTKVEGVIQREMEGKGVKSEDEIEGVRDALANKMMDDMKSMVADSKDINETRQWGATYLHVACCNGYNDVVQYLLEQPSINPNISDQDGNTPLHHAVFFCQYECVMYLVAKGADLATKNNSRMKPIVMSEDQTMIRLITALVSALQYGHHCRRVVRPYSAFAIHSSPVWLTTPCTFFRLCVAPPPPPRQIPDPPPLSSSDH